MNPVERLHAFTKALWPVMRATTRNQSSRGGAPIRAVVIHTTESADGTLAAIVRWFQRATSRASSHYIVGTVKRPGSKWVRVTRLVSERLKAWTSRSANPTTINYELVGRARRTRAEWLGPYRAQLETTAALVAEDVLQYGIPVKRDYPGILGHGDLDREGFPNDHTDPGPGFPWEWFLGRVRFYVTAGRDERPAGRTPLPKEAWTWARWWLGIHEFAACGPRNPVSRPDVPKRIPARWWNAVKFYKRRLSQV